MTNTHGKIEQARALVEHAALQANLDEALAILMAEAGISSGDVAGQFFSEFDDEYDHWQKLETAERSALLDRYLNVEMAYIEA